MVWLNRYEWPALTIELHGQAVVGSWHFRFLPESGPQDEPGSMSAWGHHEAFEGIAFNVRFFGSAAECSHAAFGHHQSYRALRLNCPKANALKGHLAPRESTQQVLNATAALKGRP